MKWFRNDQIVSRMYFHEKFCIYFLFKKRVEKVIEMWGQNQLLHIDNELFLFGCEKKKLTMFEWCFVFNGVL